MKSKKIFIFAVFVAVCVSATILSAARIIDINNKYPNPKIVKHSVDEVIDGGKISICVNKSKLITQDELIKEIPNYINYTENFDGTKVGNDQIKVLLIYCNIINNTDIIQTFSVGQMYAESLTWSNGIDGDIYHDLNKLYNNPMEIEIESQKSISLVLPYVMYDFQFQKCDWKQVATDNFDLTLSVYPTKHIVMLE